METGSQSHGQTKPLTKSYRDNVISDSECRQIVENALGKGAFSIVSYSLDTIPGHLGFLGEYFSLTVIVQKDGGSQSTEKYFVKSLPIGDENQRAMMEELGFFRKEVLVYSRILAKFIDGKEGSHKWRPNCYYTRDDLIVLEDLKWRQSFSMIHFKTALEKPFLHLVLENVAQMHAESLNYEKNVVQGKRLDDIHADVLKEIAVQRKNGWFVAGLKAIKAIALNKTRYSKIPQNKRQIESEIDEKLNQIFEIVKPTTTFQCTLVHRDIWLNNLMFSFEKDSSGNYKLDAPQACMLIDFQICRYLPPCIDVLQLLHMTTRRKQRDAHLDQYLEFYYEKFSSKLRSFNLDPEKTLSWSEFQTSMDHYRMIPLTFAVIYLALTNLPENVLDDLHNSDPDRYHYICNIDRDDFVLQYMDSDEFYRETMTECVEELLEFFFGFKN
ncbi:uncharacterized protein LOC129743943 isoform X1 [Uranotaenia lowii]|uniref:uncharacterized protein LOC129743943 isoform X1 n=1 Tax=Uranotaenia lowii TaxID=190385 RepID=UPI00247AFAA1|nr:uncharacterized protein LOC129743943 isoform X1 [Uranotaenia lowii]